MEDVLSYLWLVKTVDNCFRLSTSLFGMIQERSLSMVFVKEKVDEGMEVRPEAHLVEEVQQDDFNDTILYGTQESFNTTGMTKVNKRAQVLNQSTTGLNEEKMVETEGQLEEKLMDN